MTAKLPGEAVREESSRPATKADVCAAIAESTAELVRWIVGMGVLQMTLIAVLVFTLR